MTRLVSHSPLSGLLGPLFLALAGCGEGPPTSTGEPPPFVGPTWGAECRVFPPSNALRALDARGETLFAGPAGYFLDDADSALPSLSFDSGSTWTPVTQPVHPNTGLRVFTRTYGAWMLGGEAIFVAVDPPDALEAVSTQIDWMVVSVDGGRTFSRQMATFGRFPVADRVEANRKWEVGEYGLALADGTFYATIDGGASWATAESRSGALDDAWTVTLEPEELAPPNLIVTHEDGFGVRLAFASPIVATDVESAIVLDDELLFVLRANPTDRTRDRLLCRASLGREPSLVAPFPKALGRVVPGELALYSRVDYRHRGELGLLSQLAISPSQKVYVGTGSAIAVGGFPSKVVPTALDQAGALDVTIARVESVLHPEELGITAIVREGARDGGGARRLRTWDTRSGRFVVADQFPSMRTTALTGPTTFGRASTIASHTLVVRNQSSVHLSPRLGTDPVGTEATVFLGKTFFSGRSLVQIVRSGPKQHDSIVYVTDAVRSGRIPDASAACAGETLPPNCFELEDTTVAVALTDRSGRVYVLDYERRRLLRQRHDKPSELEVFVDGLHAPTDFQIVARDGREFALILDLDVYAVDLASEAPITRRHP